MCVCVCGCARAQLCLTLCDPMDVAHLAPLSMGFPGKNTGVGCHFLLQGVFLSPESPALAGGFFTTAPPGKPMIFTDMFPYSCHV